MLPREIQKYINKTSYHDWKLAKEPNRLFELIVVIPVIAEYENLQLLVKSLEQNSKEYLEKTLFIFVVNNLTSTSDEIKTDNKKTIEMFNQYNHQNLNLAFVDASSHGNELPAKDGGVGVARKIGMDLALRYYDYNSKTKRIMVALDGDCTVDSNYLETIYNAFNNKKLSAGYVNFSHSHIKDEENLKAILCYEIFLRYYVLGLQFANSPYAFHTIGSTMACDAESYVKAGGMNKRKAAEDFYFMEKLSKNSKIVKIDGTSIYPSSRGSWRVPFGTGQRVNRYLANERDEYELYSPYNFLILKNWVKEFHSEKIKTSNEYLAIAESISPSLKTFLEENTFAQSWDKIIANTKSEEQINKQKKIWFDGFRTLKLIHYLRDTENPNIPMFDALDKMFSLVEYKNIPERTSSEIPPISIQEEYLKILRKIA